MTDQDVLLPELRRSLVDAAPGRHRRRRRRRTVVAALSAAAAVAVVVVGTAPWAGDDAVDVATVDRPGEDVQVLGEETDEVLLLDDGYDGVLAVDLDTGVAARWSLPGQRPGDQPFRLRRVGDRLVVGWGEIWAVDYDGSDPQRLGEATIFLPADDEHVWLIDWDGGRIGSGDVTYSLVDLDGNVVGSAPGVPDASPVIGVGDRLVLQTDDGLDLWDLDAGAVVDDVGSDTSVALDSDGEHLVHCLADCGIVTVENVDTGVEWSMSPGFEGATGYVDAAVAPGGTMVAAATRGLAGLEVAMVDRRVGSTQNWDDDLAIAAWAPDGDAAYVVERSYGRDTTALGRIGVEDETMIGTARETMFASAVLPVAGAVSAVVADAGDVPILGELPIGAEADCPAPTVYPAEPREPCAFRLDLSPSPAGG
ncbi:MAG: hypothetical protein S0880_01145 [Actinomycetota bacterium]|nr:hypothetical protein [Actinomycetota bacterium]